jgi:hypothetical protein
MFEQKRVDLVFVLIVGSAVVLFVCRVRKSWHLLGRALHLSG